EAGALEVRPGLVDPDLDLALRVVGGLDDAERRPELPARQRTRVAVGQDPERTEVHDGQRRQAELGEPAVVGRRLADDRVRLGPERGGNRLAVLDELADVL